MPEFESIPNPLDLQRSLSVDPGQLDFVKRSRETIIKILNQEDPRLLLIVGPCSIHDIKAAKEYALKLKQLSQQVSKSFFIVMRAYMEKPRTTTGWKGLLYDPHLDGSHDIPAGLNLSRQFLLDLASLGVPAATEFLDPITPFYFGDLVSWGSIGARTTASQIHRQLVSGLKMAVGFKNTTDGDLSIVVNALASATGPHTYIGINEKGQAGIVRTKGNPHVHSVLRGHENSPNYDPASIQLTLDLLKRADLPPRLLVDCSHDNCYKKHENQPHVFQSVVHQIIEGNTSIRGMMVESNLQPGNQPLLGDPRLLKYAVSLTDACLGWETTEQLIHWADEKLQTHRPEIACKCVH
jgi:3-deoxy-7-phosphoheptulonate synthase